MDDSGHTAGHAFIEFPSTKRAIAAKMFGDGHRFDKMWVERDCQRLLNRARV